MADSDNQALVPDLPILEAEPIQETETLEQKLAEDSDKELAALLHVKGFERLSAEMRQDIELFRTGGFIKDIEKAPLEEVGKLFVIHQTVATFLQKYLDKVEGAAKAVAENEARRQPK